MAADRDHDVIEAIARDLREWGCREPDTAAREIMAIVRGLGYRPRIEPPEDWKHGGPGLPTQGSEAATLLGEYRARQEAGHA